MKKVLEIKPKYHIFGHIHESGGKSITKNGIIFANVSQCGSRKILNNRPFKFTLDL
jgi:Icc-related predicted phosphoesterase